MGFPCWRGSEAPNLSSGSFWDLWRCTTRRVAERRSRTQGVGAHGGRGRATMGVPDLDVWIEKLRKCEYLPENDLKALCEYVEDILVEESNVQVGFPAAARASPRRKENLLVTMYITMFPRWSHRGARRLLRPWRRAGAAHHVVLGQA